MKQLSVLDRIYRIIKNPFSVSCLPAIALMVCEDGRKLKKANPLSAEFKKAFWLPSIPASQPSNTLSFQL